MAADSNRRTKGSNKLGSSSDFLSSQVQDSQLDESSGDEVQPVAPLSPPLPLRTVSHVADRVGTLLGTGRDDVIERIEALEAAVASVRKRQVAMEQKHEEGESIRRGQLDCLSQRVFEAEKTQRQVQERTDDAISKAGAAFQKTASNMEQERSNLMCVINQVNQNFEHLSRELSQMTDVVSRGQQELLHVQQEVVDLRQQDVEMSQRVQRLEELQDHRLEALTQRINMQILEIQRQLAPLVNSEMANAAFQAEARACIEDLRHMAYDGEAQCRSFAERFSRLQSEVSAYIADEVRRHIKEGFLDRSRAREPGRPDEAAAEKAAAERRGPLQMQAPSDESAKTWLEGERRKGGLSERLPGRLPPYPDADDLHRDAPAEPKMTKMRPQAERTGLAFRQDDMGILHNGEQRLLELLLTEDNLGDLSTPLGGSRRWLSQGPEAESLPAPTVAGMAGFRVH
ncbi:unnamed protein product [Symbiodinium natans]|uniref:Uncharacterized protein n=1 Tax=Symbiodinium natans TaxID=878477 RepID=A0A812I4L3_9DINO|nr:unnamed protein product [Symbiodinium natans]